MITFRDLGVSEALIEVLADKNIKAPTPIQQQAIPKSSLARISSA